MNVYLLRIPTCVLHAFIMAESSSNRASYWPALLPLAAAAAAFVRWQLQGSGNIYTTPEKRFFVADPDLGWRTSQTEALWIGLDAIGILVACAVAIAAATYLIRRRETTRGKAWKQARFGLLLAGFASFVLPIGAFASGTRPKGGIDALPAPVDLSQLPDTFEGGLVNVTATGFVIDSSHSRVVAKLLASGEEFDGIFAKNITGKINVHFSDLQKGGDGLVVVPAKGIDTGNDMRSEHAREYLEVEKHPNIEWKLEKFTASRIETAQSIQLRAHGAITILGKAQPVVFTGTAKKLTDEARNRLGIASTEVVALDGSFKLKLSATGLGDIKSSFGRDDVTIVVSLFLTPAPSI